MIDPRQIIQFMRSGGSPTIMMQQMMQQNPQLQQMFNGVNFNDPNAMEQACKNICLQKGLDYDTMLSQFKQNGGDFK